MPHIRAVPGPKVEGTCIVISWFIDTKKYQDTGDWRPLARSPDPSWKETHKEFAVIARALTKSGDITHALRNAGRIELSGTGTHVPVSHASKRRRVTSKAHRKQRRSPKANLEEAQTNSIG